MIFLRLIIYTNCYTLQLRISVWPQVSVRQPHSIVCSYMISFIVAILRSTYKRTIQYINTHRWHGTFMVSLTLKSGFTLYLFLLLRTMKYKRMLMVGASQKHIFYHQYFEMTHCLNWLDTTSQILGTAEYLWSRILFFIDG